MASVIATLTRPVTHFHEIRTVEREVPLLLSADYPLFGAKIGVRRLLRAERMPDAKRWFVRQCLQGSKLPLPALWDKLLRSKGEWFSAYWRVRLYEASRDLDAGDYIFEPITNFSRIPGNPGDQIETAYIRAYLELRGKMFTYLDLVWEKAPGGVQKLITPKGLRRTLQAQQLEVFQFVNRWLGFYRTERFLGKRLREALYVSGCVANVALLPCQPILRSLVRWHEDRLRDTLKSNYRDLKENLIDERQASPLQMIGALLTRADDIPASKLVRWDPVIVFEDPEYKPASFGGMPLGLIAHW